MKQDRIRVLMIDDDERLCTRCAVRLAGRCELRAEHSRAAGLAACQGWSPDVVLLDLYLEDDEGFTAESGEPSGFRLLEEIQAEHRNLSVIMLTRERSHTLSLRAGRQGAFDYLCRPPGQEDLLRALRLAYTQARLRAQQAEFLRDVGRAVGEIDAELQPALLRVIEAGRALPMGADHEVQVDVRLIAATNRNLEQAVAQGAFRADLYFRLRQLEIRLPALRDRSEDILPLAHLFVEREARRQRKRILGLTTAAETQLQSQSWPGNIRELKQTILRAVLFCDGKWITLADLATTTDPRHPTSTVDSLDITGAFDHPLPAASKAVTAAFECRYVIAKLEAADGNVSRAAQLAGMARPAFRKVMKRCGVSRVEFVGSF